MKKRNIIINSRFTALVLTDKLLDGVNQVSKDTDVDEEILAFDTSLHICYAFIKTTKSVVLTEREIPIKKFRHFAMGKNTNHEVYSSIIKDVIKKYL